MLPGGPERGNAQIQLLMGEADRWRKWEWQAASGYRSQLTLGNVSPPGHGCLRAILPRWIKGVCLASDAS
ncbi:hypothetical protein VCV18_001245 [Metarhizium anisopliae]